MAYPIEKYFRNSKHFLNDLQNRSDIYWAKRGDDAFLDLFKKMSKDVPAYGKFLKQNKINPDTISSLEDSLTIPSIDKESYLKKYELEELCWDGNFSDKSWVISSTSGSTGEPFYFPRTEKQDLQYALTAELYLLANFNIDKKSTLYINGFAMGVWIGGLFTYQAIKHIAEKGQYKISIINPGINKAEILKAVKRFGPYFDQIIIGGYPPFIKDFVDYSLINNINWKKINVKFIFSAEGFSEDFRNYIFQRTHLKNYYKDTLNHYGTVDIGTKSYETPISILIRKLALKNKKLYLALFSNTNKLPTLTQYIPEQFYFESFDNHLFCSSCSGLPLFKYNLKDKGGVLSYKEILEKCQESGIDLMKEAKKEKIDDTVWKLPFVYVYEREDFSVSFYGANIYPESIRKILFNEKFINFVTGKCVLEINMTDSQDQELYIHIEKKLGITNESLIKKELKDLILEILILENSEYKNNFNLIGNRAIPKILFWDYENTKYFNSIGKQKWVKK